jgi:hypothetical protein
MKFGAQVTAPSLHLLPSIFKGHEPVGVEALRSEAAVKGFYECVIRRLRRLFTTADRAGRSRGRHL